MPLTYFYYLIYLHLLIYIRSYTCRQKLKWCTRKIISEFYGKKKKTSCDIMKGKKKKQIKVEAGKAYQNTMRTKKMWIILHQKKINNKTEEVKEKVLYFAQWRFRERRLTGVFKNTKKRWKCKYTEKICELFK